MEPIPCFVAGNKGYVWDANGAMRLRKKHRIMGCLVGTVAQFKNQNEVNFLPLELSADEVTLAVRQGWVELFPGTAAPIRSAAERAATLNASTAAAGAKASGAKASGGGAGAAAWSGRRGADAEWEDMYQEYYSQFDPLVGFTGRFLPLMGPKRRKLSQQQPEQQPQQHQEPQQEPQQQQPGAGFSGRSAAVAAASGKDERGGKPPVEKPAEAQAVAVAAAAPDLSEPGWRAAVTDGGPYDLPLTAAAAASARAGVAAVGPAAQSSAQRGTGAKAEAASKDTGGTMEALAGVLGAEGTGRDACMAAASTSGQGGGRVEWHYPCTDYERLRFSVFCDLHRQGFMMTGGIKFGSDMLAYPGDPSLYHAQFTVRPVPPGTALNPMVLKAVARGSHAARKHLLLAFYEDGVKASAGGSPRIKYMSFAPEAGFGSTA